MNRYEPGISYPRRRDDWVRDHPLASRLLIMIVGFAVLIPIGLIVKAGQGNVVRSGGLPGAVVAADPVIVPSTTTSVAGAVAAVPSAPSTAAPSTSVAPSTSTAAPAVAAAEVAPSTTAAAKKATTTTGAPATTAAKKVATTAAKPKPTSPPTTRRAPTTTTTEAPTTTTTEAAAAPPANTYSKADVEAIIRSVFPADQADEAVRVATRESNLVPTVRNWCCYGLFQIYFKMNQKTLAAIGVTSAEQLYDPTVNAQAAYAIFQRSGWAPWR